jgi:Tol biopolymer transport system component
LRFTVESVLAGRGDQIKEYLLGVEVFDREVSYNPQIDPIVRVEAGRVRSKLKEYYEKEGRQDPVVIEFPKGSYVPVFEVRNATSRAEPLTEISQEGEAGVRAKTRGVRRSKLVAVGLVLTLAAGIGIAWWCRRSATSNQGPILTRLTWDSGLTTDPAISKDGKLLAYASDRGGAGNLDIWVQQIPGGEPIPITRHEADDREPSFSPDGSQIVFQSDRDGGGIYVVPALGGDEGRLIVKIGHFPQFSPDGKWISYDFGGTFLALVGKCQECDSGLRVMPASGGPSRPIQPEFAYAGHSVWSPEGKHLLFLGGKEAEEADWWVTSLEGGVAIKTGVLSSLRRHGLSIPRLSVSSRYPRVPFGQLMPSAWRADNSILFSASLADSTNLWKVSLSPGTFRVNGPPVPLTSGTALELQPSISAEGTLAFSSSVSNTDVWGLPVDANLGKVSGEIERLTENAATEIRPTISADGKKLVFLSDRSGQMNVWTKDLSSGKETPLGPFPKDKFYPVVSPDGSMIAFGVRWMKHSPLSMWLRLRVVSRKRFSRKTADQNIGLRTARNCSPFTLAILRIVLGSWTHRSEENKPYLLKHAKYQTASPRFSRDNAWITFYLVTSPTTRQIFITPFRDEASIDQKEWIAVTDGSTLDFEPRWSPDGSLIYFLSDRDQFRCIWAQRLDRVTKRPVSTAFEVYPFHVRDFPPGTRTLPYGIGCHPRQDRSQAWRRLQETSG